MNTSPPTLLELQHATHHSIVSCDDTEVSTCVVADGIDPPARLGIYRNTFASVLTNALRLSFPATHKLVAAECFEGAARLSSRWIICYGDTSRLDLCLLAQP